MFIGSSGAQATNGASYVAASSRSELRVRLREIFSAARSDPTVDAGLVETEFSLVRTGDADAGDGVYDGVDRSRRRGRGCVSSRSLALHVTWTRSW